MDSQRQFSVGDLLDTNEIPVYVKNYENELVINIRAYEFDIERDDGLVDNYNKLGLIGFEVDGEYFEITEIERGSALQQFFPTLYRGIQNALMTTATGIGLY